MPTVKVYNMAGQETGELELNAAIFGIEPNVPAMHAVVKNYLANCRQGTQSTLTRSEVRGGGIKPWRQKGTGHARQGSTRSPQWRHGGVVFAPVPRSYSFKMNRREKQAALRSVLTSKLQDNNLIVVDKLTFDAPKTKSMVKVLENLKAEKAYIVTKESDKNVLLSTRNLPNAMLSHAGSLNTYDILRFEKLILTQDAVKTIEEVFA